MITMFAAAAGIGALAAFFLDPISGKRRRAIARDRALSFARRGAGRAERLGRAAGAQAYGAAQKAIHEGPPRFLRPDELELDDVTLARKVESELFRGRDVERGRVNVSVENGVVVLVGEVDRVDQVEALGTAARAIAGVKGVDNLLHLPGTPAPAKHHMIESR